LSHLSSIQGRGIYRNCAGPAMRMPLKIMPINPLCGFGPVPLGVRPNQHKVGTTFAAGLVSWASYGLRLTTRRVHRRCAAAATSTISYQSRLTSSMRPPCVAASPSLKGRVCFMDRPLSDLAISRHISPYLAISRHTCHHPSRSPAPPPLAAPNVAGLLTLAAARAADFRRAPSTPA